MKGYLISSFLGDKETGRGIEIKIEIIAGKFNTAYIYAKLKT